MSYNLKTIKQEFKNKGIFYTPKELAEKVKSYIPFEPKEVYDPTCGDGGLLSVFGDDVKKYGQEINHDQLAAAESRLVNFTGYCGDTLTDDGFDGKKFDAIVANPPFSIKWTPASDKRFEGAPTIPTASRADFAFLIHIDYHLADGGVAAILSFPGVLYRSGREQKLRKYFIERGLISKVINVPADTFIDTTIATAIIVFDKRQFNDSIEFIDGDDVVIVSSKDIEENDFNLSVSSYVIKEIEREVINPIELEMNARKRTLTKLRSDIQMSVMACEFEGMDVNAYLDEIVALVEEFRGKL